MNSTNPVYTLVNECHDCYKCIRSCQVKAIKLESGHASVIPEQCIACGNCVKACPSNAKQVRNDLKKVQNLILSRKIIYASLAPSWVGSFSYSSKEIIAKLKTLGFYAVSETALGAQEVSIQVAKMLQENTHKLLISSACPVIVDYIKLYQPDFTQYITPIASPAVTHAKMLKELYGDDIAVVFIGPCIAKKNESDCNHKFIDAALTFAELKFWFEENITYSRQNQQQSNTEQNTDFIPYTANEGSLYPLTGGMNDTIKIINHDTGTQMISICSLDLFAASLHKLDPQNLSCKIFIEALACDGGCINGPCIATDKSLINMTSNVLSNTHKRSVVPTSPNVVVKIKYQSKSVVQKQYPIEAIIEVMKKIGKYTGDDELNCGGCGYSTCRELAAALLSKNAEPSMCVSYMRKLAIRKTTAMLKCMPSAMVIVDSNLKILEANDVFMKMFLGKDYELFAARQEGLIGASLNKVIDFIDIFNDVLKYGKEIHKEDYSYKDSIYDISVFSIEENECVGAIITDVTKTEINREKIARKAQQVISSNISIVQEIACLLGEHIVETETLLSSIADTYHKDK